MNARSFNTHLQVLREAPVTQLLSSLTKKN